MGQAVGAAVVLLAAAAVAVKRAAKRRFLGESRVLSTDNCNMHAAREPSRRRGRARHLVIRAPPALIDILLLPVNSQQGKRPFHMLASK